MDPDRRRKRFFVKYQRSDKQAGALIVWYSVTGEMTEDRAAGSAGNEHSAPPPTETAGPGLQTG